MGRSIDDKKMGMWEHEYRRGSWRVHAYQTWRVDKDGNEYDFRGSYVECGCNPTTVEAGKETDR